MRRSRTLVHTEYVGLAWDPKFNANVTVFLKTTGLEPKRTTSSHFGRTDREQTPAGTIVASIPRLGGLHHRYFRPWRLRPLKLPTTCIVWQATPAQATQPRLSDRLIPELNSQSAFRSRYAEPAFTARMSSDKVVPVLDSILATYRGQNSIFSPSCIRRAARKVVMVPKSELVIFVLPKPLGFG